MSEDAAATCRGFACDEKLVVPPPTGHNPKHDCAIVAITVALEPQHGHDHPAGAAAEGSG